MTQSKEDLIVNTVLEALDQVAKDLWPAQTSGVKDAGASDGDLRDGLLAALQAQAGRLLERYSDGKFR